jgi:hypothetical protein
MMERLQAAADGRIGSNVPLEFRLTTPENAPAATDESVSASTAVIDDSDADQGDDTSVDHYLESTDAV